MNELRLKQLNQQMGWTYGTSPQDNIHYWVTDGIHEQFVAIADPGSSNGWTNNDTWEDFHSVIIAYKKIQKPFFKV